VVCSFGLFFSNVDRVLQKNETTIKVDMFPFQLKHLPATHTGKQDHLHHVLNLDVGIFLNGFEELLELLIRKVFGHKVADGRFLDLEGKTLAQILFNTEVY
jgi:hypothetical protein